MTARRWVAVGGVVGALSLTAGPTPTASGAVATSVFVLAVAATAGAAVHALAATPVWYVVAWSIPGVLLGGTVGTRVGKYVPSEVMEPALGVVFSLVGVVVLASELLA